MDKNNQDTELDFLDDLSQLSAPLMQIATIAPIAYSDLPMGSFITINSVICFKRFETRYLSGVGDANISRTLGQIRELSCFRDLCTIVWDNSDTTTFDTKTFSLVKELICKLPWNTAFYLIWKWMKAQKEIFMKVTS